ncbi:regulatory P domain protein [Apiospora sp. TS-2023a]
MKATVASLLLAAMGTGSEARPREVQISAQMFGPAQLEAFSAPQAVSMDTMKQEKLGYRDVQRAAGTYDLNRYERAGPAPCVNGTAAGYACNRVDLKDFLRHQDMGATKVLEGNDVWGWTSADGREFGAVGQAEGTAFVEVKSDGSLVYLGRLPTQTTSSTWRDMKTIKNHIYIGSEAKGHGLQIFDMRKLLEIDPASPVTFPLSSLTAHFDAFGSSHNVVANEETNMIYVVGTERSLPCRAGLWMIDVFHPDRPQDVGCVSSDGYVHDAQCVAYQGREICFNYNEDALTIVDVSRKPTPVMLSRTTYNGATYTHQGWLANADMTYLLLDDELDESRQNGPAADQRTTTYVVDITDLTHPVFKSIYKSPAKSIDHNQYVIDGLSGFTEVGYFDCRPEDDAVNGEATFDGSWSAYPFFKSGYILLNSIERGVFSLKYHG